MAALAYIIDAMVDDELDLFLEDPIQPLAPEELGTTLVPATPMTKKQMNQSILNVYQQLGGDAWLMKQAETFPKEFMAMLKPLIEKDADTNITGINITIDGSSVRVEGRSHKELGVLNASRH